MYVDRRRTIRAPCDLPVEWKRGRKLIQARARDINRDGVFIVTPHEMELNQLVDLSVGLPTARVSLLGVTRFCGKTRMGHGLGVAIHAIEPEDRQRWDAYYRIAIEEMLRRLPAPIARMLRVVDR